MVVENTEISVNLVDEDSKKKKRKRNNEIIKIIFCFLKFYLCFNSIDYYCKQKIFERSFKFQSISKIVENKEFEEFKEDEIRPNSEINYVYG